MIENRIDLEKARARLLDTARDAKAAGDEGKAWVQVRKPEDKDAPDARILTAASRIIGKFLPNAEVSMYCPDGPNGCSGYTLKKDDLASLREKLVKTPASNLFL